MGIGKDIEKEEADFHNGSPEFEDHLNSIEDDEIVKDDEYYKAIVAEWYVDDRGEK